MSTKRIWIYVANIFLGFHYYLIIYINSSFLSQFFQVKDISLLYTTGACLTIFFLLILPKVIERVSVKSVIILVTLIELACVLGLSAIRSSEIVRILFIAEQAIGLLIYYCLDLYLESTITNEGSTGRARAIFLTCINSSLVISLFVVSRLAENSFSLLYTLSALALLPVLGIIFFAFNKNIHKNEIPSTKSMLNFITADKDVLRVLFVNFAMQLFFAVMVVYLPFLLVKAGAFSWREASSLIVIMILPFVIFEPILGRLFDRKTGEKEFLAAGIIIMFISTLVLSQLHQHLFWLWAVVLFMTRVGASFVEIGTESYFFKKVTDRDSSVISIFRMTAPSAFVFLSFFVIPILSFTNESGLFFALSVFTLIAVFFIPRVDSR